VVDCLDDADETLKFKTLDLLYKMTNSQNVEPVTEKLLSQLSSLPVDSGVRKDLVLKINSLGERFAPNNTWYVKTINRLFEMGGDMVTQELSNKFISTLSDFEKETNAAKFRESTIKIYLKILKKNKNVPDSLIRVISWIFGEYGTQDPDRSKRVKILCRLSEAVHRGWEDPSTVVWMLAAITKVHASLDFEANAQTEKVVTSLACSKHLEVQQRCREYQHLRTCTLSTPFLI